MSWVVILIHIAYVIGGHFDPHGIVSWVVILIHSAEYHSVGSFDPYTCSQNEKEILIPTTKTPKGRPGMSDLSPLSRISVLSYDSPFLAPLDFLPSPLVFSFL